MEINMKRGLPGNMVLLGNSDTLVTYAHFIISEEKVHHPEKFEGNRDCFDFELRYVAPFDKNFFELKRLQGAAAEAAGRRAEFKGYIVIDFNAWLTHQNEDYLNKTLLFLADMSEWWKYIFLINNKNEKVSRELAGKLLAVFFQNHIICKVEECTAKASIRDLASSIYKELGVVCTSLVKEIVEELLIQGFEKTIVSALLSEISWYCGKKITMDVFVSFASEWESSIRYMLPQKEHCRLISIIEQRKENLYGEKEEV